MKKKAIQEIRAFNRWYTDMIGLLDQHLLNSDWSLAEARLIYEIHAGQPIQASQLIAIMHIDKSYLSRLLKKLEKEKIITKRRSPMNGRAASRMSARYTRQLLKSFLAPLATKTSRSPIATATLRARPRRCTRKPFFISFTPFTPAIALTVLRLQADAR